MEELISIVIPVYNVEKYIEECLDSIINQTYDNIEIILIDDGSTDNSGNLCDEYARKDKRIKVVHKKNAGASDARNKGIALSTGKYIAFVDADDLIHKNYIRILLEIIREKLADIAVGGYSLFQDKKECQDKLFDKNYLSETEILSDKHLYDDSFIKNETMILTVPWGKLFKKELWEGIEYPVGKINEDTFTSYKVMENAKRVAFLKEPIYYWRNNPDSVTRSKFSLKYLHGLEAFQEQLEYFKYKKKQRYIEIVYDAYRDWFFWSYNEMKKANMDYKKELRPYYEYMRNNIRHIKLTKSIGFYKWLKYRYLIYYKIPKILKY